MGDIMSTYNIQCLCQSYCTGIDDAFGLFTVYISWPDLYETACRYLLFSLLFRSHGL